MFAEEKGSIFLETSIAMAIAAMTVVTALSIAASSTERLQLSLQKVEGWTKGIGILVRCGEIVADICTARKGRSVEVVEAVFADEYLAASDSQMLVLTASVKSQGPAPVVSRKIVYRPP